MHRIDTQGAVANLHGAGKAGFADRNLQTGVAGTVVDAAWLNSVGESLARVVEAAGQALAKGDHDQLLAAIRKLAQAVYYNRLAKSVAGGANVALTAAEAGYALLEFTGALTANIAVIVPAASAQWIVKNSTSGNYTLTVKTAAGAGVAIAQGRSQHLVCDGASVAPAVTEAGELLVAALTAGGEVKANEYSIEAKRHGVRPSLLLDFANTRRLDSRVQFTRASVGWCYDRHGVYRQYAINEPRFDHDPLTGLCRGLLIEPTRTNLLLHSGDPGNAAWVKDASSITAGATTGPDGLASAAKLVESTTTAPHTMYQTVNKTASPLIYSLTFFLKAAERTLARLYLSGSSTGDSVHCTVNLTTGTVSSVTSLGGFSGAVAVSRNAGGGWWAVSLSGTSNTDTVIRARIYTLLTEGGSTSYAGDGTSGIYVWTGQLEEAPFATSYIPTTTSTATRAADSATMSGSNFSSWYNQTEGTILVEADTQSNQADNTLFAIGDGSILQLDQVDARVVASANTIRSRVRSGGATTLGELANVVSSVASPFRLAFAFAVNDAASTSNGSAIAADNSGAMPSVAMTRIMFGDRETPGGEDVLSGHIARFAYYPRRLSTAELVELSKVA